MVMIISKYNLKGGKNKKITAKKGKKVAGKRKGKLNPFFLKVKDARDNNKSQFEYNGKTYKRKNKGHLIFYA